ncbi:glycerophosphodiester phosphodiesterase [Streptomyces apocyni]|uniref:glycerophosphodiester phosphodiesterase n=1 Tax=Streptomyces apocyni TaxID=2654677 RepID=UPI0012EADF86|nr:glycerophosphodiester phosphodiesterase family protein [Streptomyces apocyni]
MYVRPATATTAVLLGVGALVIPVSTAQANPATPDTPLVVAHRGASAYAPENTIESLDKAADMGFRWAETDVQRTLDGKLVMMHDATLARTTNVEEVFPDRAPWRVADFTYAEIARLDAGSWFDTRYAGARVPTLKQYLHRVRYNHQKLVLEIKQPALYPGIEKNVLAVLRKTGWLDWHHVKSKLVVQSFSADSVKKVHAQRPDVKTGFLGTPPVADLPEYAKFAHQINSRHTTISADYVAAVQALKGPLGKPLEVFTWTIDDAANARRAAGFGVDGIITNKPDVVRDALGD